MINLVHLTFIRKVIWDSSDSVKGVEAEVVCTCERNFINITLHFIKVDSLWKSKKRLNLNFNLMKKYRNIML